MERVPENWKEALARLSDESREQMGYILFDSPIKQTATMLAKKIQTAGKSDDEVAEAFRDVEREDLIPLKWRSSPPPVIPEPRLPPSCLVPTPVHTQAPVSHSQHNGRRPDKWKEAFARLPPYIVPQIERILLGSKTEAYGASLFVKIEPAGHTDAQLADAFRAVSCEGLIPHQFLKLSAAPRSDPSRPPDKWEEAFKRLSGPCVSEVEYLLLGTREEAFGINVWLRLKNTGISDKDIAEMFSVVQCKGLIPAQYLCLLQH